MNRFTLGIILTAAGLLLLALRFGGEEAWAAFILVPGLVMLAAGLTGPRSAAGLVVPGSIVSVTGVILLLQTLTGRFDTWSYTWGLIVAAVGLGTFLEASLTNDEDEQREGLRLIRFGLVGFAAFGLFFELLVYNDRLQGIARWLLPAALIVAGLFLLRRKRDTA